MNKTRIYKAGNIFTGNAILHNYAVVVRDGLVQLLLPADAVPGNEAVRDLGDALLAPAFIDLQIYGARQRLLAVYPDAATVTAIVEYCAAGGAAYSQPTVATNAYETIFRCIDAVKEYRQQGGKGVIGLHVEGPWINPVKRGAHREEWIFAPSVRQTKELLDYGRGVITMITLAPEVCKKEVIELVQSYGVIVSAGHTNATYDEAKLAFDNGITAATHLFNAMSPLQHRAPGMVGAVMDHARVFCSIVPDGHHVDFAAVRIAKKAMGERLYAITDAVTETGEGYYKHTFEGDKYTSNGILSGSALTMHQCFLNFVQHCGINTEEALRMCSLYPAQLMGLQHKLGVIQSGAEANLVVMDKELRMTGMISPGDQF